MRFRLPLLLMAVCFLDPPSWAATNKKEKVKESPLDVYVREATERTAPKAGATPGSIWTAGSLYGDLGADLRARHVDDIVTILVAEKASAISTGTTKTSRKSSVNASIGAAAGLKSKTGRLTNLASTTTDTQLDGQGATSRSTTLTTTLAARVTHVLPNGNLVVQAEKLVQVNSEQQVVGIRGVVRPADINPANQVRSDDLAQLEVRINGKGVVGDSIRRPFFLYRLLLGLLPF